MEKSIDSFFSEDGRVVDAGVVAPITEDRQPTAEELAELTFLREENARLQKMQRQQSLTLKVSEKGAVSIYGIGRFPITAYADAWLKILAIAPQIKAFIEANRSKLSFK